VAREGLGQIYTASRRVHCPETARHSGTPTLQGSTTCSRNSPSIFVCVDVLVRPAAAAHPGVLATKVGYFGVKSTNVLRAQMGTKPAKVGHLQSRGVNSAKVRRFCATKTPPPRPPRSSLRGRILCSIPDRKDHTTVRAALLEPSSCGLRDFARTHRAHAGASYGGRIA